MKNQEELLKKLKILADAAKYDVSCSSSGIERRGSSGKIGSAAAAGICHSWTADGRCISLLKLLYTNRCSYDCAYCINRRSNETERASFTPQELADLTMEFYRRNYIEGLFLSSAVDGSADRTSEEICESLRILREDYGFLGYIHAKIIPGTAPELVERIGSLADRLSVNAELPTKQSLALLAPQKKPGSISAPMRQISTALAEQKTLPGAGNRFSAYRKAAALASSGSAFLASGQNGYAESETQLVCGKALSLRQADAQNCIKRRRFAPAGQTTQMIVGAGNESDLQLLSVANAMYGKYFMKRVYFSAYVPLVDSPLLPALGSEVPLLREHRLYQADWLLRFYGFSAEEIVSEAHPNLDTEIDPKMSWALRNPEIFPLEVSRATAEELLRIPGLGTLSLKRILQARRAGKLSFDGLKRMGVVMKRAKYFITVNGRYYGGNTERDVLREHILALSGGVQLSMFSDGKGGLLSDNGIRV